VLDLKFIRANPELVKAGAAKKRIAIDLDKILALDKEWREISQGIDQMRNEQKNAARSISAASPAERPRLAEEAKAQKALLKVREEELAVIDRSLKEHLLRVPNIPAEAVPEGKDDSENVEVKRWGTPRTFEFEPRDHITLGEIQDWIDVTNGARIAGSRNYFLKGDLSLLENAVMRFALDSMVKKDFVPLSVPTLVRSEIMVGTGYFPGGEEQAYRCDSRDDLCLVGTAEVPVTALHQDAILNLADLPKKYVAQSSCYRREAGTYGKDTRGLYRVHQFQKVEQVIVDIADVERSIEHHAAIVANAEDVLQACELPYRIVNVCGGDLGQPQIQKFDIETWMPSRKGYGETHSASRFHEFQARRLNMRYRDAEGTVRFCHTLNNTVAASVRMLIALIENHQRADGTVYLPAPLRPYMQGRESIGRPVAK
jgi:seryl-tRNA synthetase